MAPLHLPRDPRISLVGFSANFLVVAFWLALLWSSACQAAEWVTVYRVPTRTESRVPANHAQNNLASLGGQPRSSAGGVVMESGERRAAESTGSIAAQLTGFRHPAAPKAPSPAEVLSSPQPISAGTRTETGLGYSTGIFHPAARSSAISDGPGVAARVASASPAGQYQLVGAAADSSRHIALPEGLVLNPPKAPDLTNQAVGRRATPPAGVDSPPESAPSAVGVAYITDAESEGNLSESSSAKLLPGQEEDPGYSPEVGSHSQPSGPLGDTRSGAPASDLTADGENSTGKTPSDGLKPPRPLPQLPDLVTSPPQMLSDGDGAAVPKSSSGTLGNSPAALCGCGAELAPADPEGPKPWRLIDGPCLQAWRISVGGWLEQGITFNAQEPSSRFNGPVATNDRHADYQLNQLWAYIVRPTKTDGCGFDIGGRVDMVFGTDWRYGINRGLEDRINGLDQYYGLVLPQFYLEVAVNYLTVKLGHFAAILDYEAVPAILNPFYSHSYSYGYTVPQLVTGVLASYQLSEQWGIDAGFHRGWMMFEDNNENLDFMGGIRWKAPSGRTELAYAVSVGPQDAAGRQDRFVYSLVLRHRLSPRLQYVLVHNLGWENDGVFWVQEGPRDAEWYGINQYFIYALSPKLSMAARIEWLRDDDGVRIAGVGNVVPGKGWPALPGFAGNFYELTLGLNWRPHPNLLVRPEARWDWYEGTTNLAGQLPFDDGSSDHQFTVATDMIFTF